MSSCDGPLYFCSTHIYTVAVKTQILSPKTVGMIKQSATLLKVFNVLLTSRRTIGKSRIRTNRSSFRHASVFSYSSFAFSWCESKRVPFINSAIDGIRQSRSMMRMNCNILENGGRAARSLSAYSTKKNKLLKARMESSDLGIFSSISSIDLKKTHAMLRTRARLQQYINIAPQSVLR